MCELVCQICGKKFLHSHPITKVCSDECRAELRKRYEEERTRKRQAERAEIKKYCAHCGKEFVAKSNSQICCSKECTNERTKALNRERYKRKSAKVCRYCGKPFEQSKEHLFYCSKECRDAWTREQQKKEYERQKKKKNLSLGFKVVAAHETGMSYAEAQMLDTLSKVPPIKRSL